MSPWHQLLGWDPLCCVVPAPRRMLLVLLLLRCAFMGCFCRWGYSSVPRVAVSISLLLSARHCCLHISLKYQAIMIDASCMRHAPCCPGWYTVASVQDTGRASVSDTEACVCFYKRVRCRGVAVRGLHAPRRVACVCMQFTGQQGTNATRAVCVQL